jgi:hypothetical protein
MKRIVLVTVLATLVLTLGGFGVAFAQRFVVVNGQLMSPAALASLDRAACRYVPNGYYWLNFTTGVWGYARNPTPMGHISDGCYQARRPSLSERRMLYTPYDLAK